MVEAQLRVIAKKVGNVDWLETSGDNLLTSNEINSLDIDLYLYLPIMKNYCTLHELRTVYCLDDLMSFHQSIAVQNKIEERSYARSN